MGKGKGEDKGMTGSSFLGYYDRELDEDQEEPLNFEEQFILRVPRDIAEGRDGKDGLKDLVRGKGKGLEGIEFKFFGMFSLTCLSCNVANIRRLSSCCL